MTRSGPSRTNAALLVAAACLLAGAGALPWWHVVDAGEPPYVVVCRALVFFSSFAILAAVFVPKWRVGVMLTAGFAALLLPVLILQIVATRDPVSIEHVIRQDNQAHWLLNTVRQDENLPYIPWTDPSKKSIVDVFSNAYTVLDAMETSSFFTQAGWFASVAVGALLLVATFTLYGPAARYVLIRSKGMVAAVVVIGVIVFYGHLLVSYLYWNRARGESSEGRYAAAISDFHTAARWDHRWNDDTLYHVEVGRLYGRVGEQGQPDYWASIADAYTRDRQYDRAYSLYLVHVQNPNVDGAMRVRYVNALLHVGVTDYNAGRVGLAVQHWQQAAAIDPSNIQALYYLAIGQAKSGDYAGALRTWKSVIRINESVGMFRLKWFTTRDYRKPITSLAWNGMGWCYYQMHDYKSAMTCRFNATLQGKTDPGIFADPSTEGDDG